MLIFFSSDKFAFFSTSKCCFFYINFFYTAFIKRILIERERNKNEFMSIVLVLSFSSLRFVPLASFFLWVVSQFSNCVKVCALGFFILQNSIRSQLVNISPVCVFSPLLLRTPYTPPVTYFHQCARVCRQMCRQMCLCDRIWNIHCRILAVLRGKE